MIRNNALALFFAGRGPAVCERLHLWQTPRRIGVLAVLLSMLAMLAAMAATNIPDNDDDNDGCADTLAANPGYCDSAAEGDPCCGCEECEGGSCETPGAENAENASVSFAVSLGQPRHESLSACRLVLKADHPSASLFTPRGLHLVRPVGGEITGVATAGLPEGVVRRVTLINLGRRPMLFDFSADSAAGMPIEEHAGSLWRLWALDESGEATLASPAFYELGMAGQSSRFRFDAATGRAVSFTNATGRRVDASTAGFSEIIVGGVLRQVLTPSTLVDILVPPDGTTPAGTIWKYTVSFYPAAVAGGQDADGVRTIAPASQAFVNFTFEKNVAADLRDTDIDHLQITRRTADGGSRVYRYDYVEASASWVLSKGSNTAILSRNALYSSWNQTFTREIKTREISSGTGELAARTVEHRRRFSWGTKTFASAVSVADDAANDLVTRTWYYASPADASVSGDGAKASPNAALYGKTAAILRPGGDWVMYGYDDLGRPALTVRPWKDLAWETVAELSVEEAAALGRATAYSYVPVAVDDAPLADDSRPRMITESIAGVAVARTMYAWLSTAAGETVEISERAVTPVSAYGATGNLRTVTTYYSPSAAAVAAGRVKSVLQPNGRLTSYAYEEGLWTPGATPGTGTFTVVAGGDAFRSVITEGTPTSPAGVANRSLRKQTVADGLGNLVLEETLVYTGAGYERLAWTAREFDDRGRVVTTWQSDGTRADAAWDCCGKSSETLADGQEYSYVYDAIGRLVIKAKENGATPLLSTYTYDAAGRQLSETVSAGGLSLTSSREVDLAGRVLRATATGGLVTTTVYADGGRVISESLPGGATRQRTSYLDGRPKSLTGTAVTDTWYDYGVDSSTVPGQVMQTTTVYQGPVPAGGAFTDILRWRRSYDNALGQTVRQESTAWGHTAAQPALAVSTQVYDEQGRLVKSSASLRADTLYEYDADLGELLRTGLDLDGNGALDLASDRVTETATSFLRDGDSFWWRGTTSKLYATDNDDPATPAVDERTLPLVTGMRRERLTGLGAETPGLGRLIAETADVDIHGNDTVSRHYLERDTATITVVTDVPESTADAVAVTVNGLLVSQTSSGNLTTRVLYDALERRAGVTDPRVSMQDAQTGLWTNINTTHYDAQGRVDYTEDTAGNRSSYAYDAAGRVAIVTNALGKSKRIAYTTRGQEWRVWGDTEYPVEYGYDAYGQRITMTTFRGGTAWNGVAWPDPAPTGDATTWTYDAASGLVTAKTYADGHGPTYTYTLDGKLATRTWARTDANDNPLTTTYSYDVATGELVGVDYSDATPDIAYAYTRTGQPATVTDVVGTRTFAYNAQLQDVSETIVGGLYSKTLTRTYTGSGKKGRKLGLAVDGVPNYSYGYDMHGRLNQISTPAGDFDYTRLANSDLVSQMTRPNGVTTTWTYEANRDLITQVQNGAISTYGYTNDAIGRRTSMSRAGSAYPTPDIITYSYNDRSEVTGALSDNVPSYTYAYTYDPIGNRISANEAGVPWTYTANNLNQYASATEDNIQLTFTYDLDGSMTYRPVDATTGWTQIWNGENRMVETWKGDDRLTFQYDYMGRRVEKKVYDGQTLTTHLKFVYDGFKLVEELDALNADAPLRRYTWQPFDVGLDVVLQMMDVPGNTYSFHLHDANKNIRMLFNAVGVVVAEYDYDPFGQVTTTGDYALVNPYRFSSEFHDDDTGLIYYNYRYDSPIIGRWISCDPIAEAGFMVNKVTNSTKWILDFQSNFEPVNMYLLSSNNPVLITDYFGLVDTSINASIRACLLLTTARQRLACLEDLLELCGQNNALQDAINKQRQSLKTAQEALNSCLGKVKREFPSQFLNNTIEEIEKWLKMEIKWQKRHTNYSMIADLKSE